MLNVEFKREQPLWRRLYEEETPSWRLTNRFYDGFVKAFTPFHARYISEVLRQWTAREMIPGSGYAILSQTGTGKSTFLLENVLPTAAENGQEVIYVTFRRAIDLQTKLRIGEKFCPEKLECLTELGIQHEHTWDNCHLYLAQEVGDRRLREELEAMINKVRYLVIDEVHLAVGDALFNARTEEIMEYLITELGKNVVRIYLTATPHNILEPLIALEKKVDETLPARCYRKRYPEKGLVSRGGNLYRDVAAGEEFTIFQFMPDFSYLSLILYQKKSRMLDFLKKGIEGKTLIFVSSISEGQRFLEELGNTQADLIYADIKNSLGATEFQKIVREHTFTKRFLIVTKFMDCGVDLLDLEIQNIVLDTLYPEEVLQMVGRKRIMSKNDTIRAYIFVPERKILEKRKRRIIEEMEKIEEFTKFGTLRDIDELPPWVFMQRQADGAYQAKVNNHAMILLKNQKKALDAFLQVSDSDYFAKAEETITSWFPNVKKTAWLDGSNDENSVLNILSEYAGREMNKDDAAEFSRRLCETAGIARRKNQMEQVAVMTVNNYLTENKLPYSFLNLSKNGKKGTWILRKEG